MIIIILLAVLLVVGILIVRFGETNAHKIGETDFEGIGSALAIFSILGLLVAFTSILPIRIGLNGDIQEFRSVQNTLAIARERGDNFEKAAIQNSIVDTNKWLAKTQYYNKNMWLWDIWIPDEVMKLEPIE